MQPNSQQTWRSIMKDNYFSALYKYAPVGIAILGGDMMIVNINPFLLALFSLTSKDYKGHSLGRVLKCASVHHTDQTCGETPDCAACHMWQSFTHVLKTGQPVRSAVINHTFMISGMPVLKTLRYSMSVVEASQGMRIIASFADISREKQYEQLLSRELDLQTIPGTVNRQNLIGIVAGLMHKAGSDNTVSIGMAAVEGLSDAGSYNGLTSRDVLNRFAEIARQCTRRQDIIGHLENNLFLFVFSGAGIHMAETITRRIHDTMNAVFGAQGIHGITFSAGFTDLKTAQLASLTSSEILRTVDRCLDTAKKRSGMFVSPEFTALLK